MNFLIVDDSSIMRDMLIDEIAVLRKGLIDKFYETEKYDEVIKILRKNRIDILILDWNIPYFDNFNLIKYIRCGMALENLNIIIITHDNKQEILMDALIYGVDSIIIKPYTTTYLHEKISEIILSKK